MAEGHSPLEQFTIKTLVQLPEMAGYNIDFTNTALWMVLAVCCAYLFLMVGMRSKALVPTRMQSLVEMSYEFISDTLKENAGEAARPYFPFIFTLFMFILMCNLLGMIPYSFTPTSHIIVTLVLAMMVFVGVTLVAIIKHGSKFLLFFLPDGTPWWMAPLMYFIELFAYLARPVSLSIRLAANMMAGHTILKVAAGFVLMMGLAGVVPFAFLVILTGFEIGIAILHAYIFTVLSCVYLNDALHLH
ncbi:MAG: F0F1 ATP synthase subunit A [Sphaerospermopsis sp. SIO1G2]|nr:F0F1 ATP synthase subunit A [Sphaerospermopsis sp. SIO1G2]